MQTEVRAHSPGSPTLRQRAQVLPGLSQRIGDRPKPWTPALVLGMGEGVGGGALPCPRDVHTVWVARQGPRDTFSGKREAVSGPSDDAIATQRTAPTRAKTIPNAFLSSRPQPSEPTISEPRGGWGGAGGSSRNPALRMPTWQYGVGATPCSSDRPSGSHGLQRVARWLGPRPPLTWSTLSTWTPNLPPKPRTESTWEQCLESFDWYSWPTADCNRVRGGGGVSCRLHQSPTARAGLLPKTHTARTPGEGVPRAA